MANLPISLNGGIYLRETDYATVRSSLDSSNIFEFFGNQSNVTDMGMLDFYANRGFMPVRAAKMANVKREFVKTNTWKYSYPMGQKEFYVVEDLSATDKPGVAGGKFRVKFNSKMYGNGWIITPDVQFPLSLLITEDEIERDGDGWIHTLKMVGENITQKHWKKDFLKLGTKYFGRTTVHTEYTQTFADIPEYGGAKREYLMHVGTSDANLKYEVTRTAAKSMVPTSGFKSYDEYQSVIQTYEFAPGTLGYNLSMLSPQEQQTFNGDVAMMYKKRYGKDAEYAMSQDAPLLNVWQPKIEYLGATLLDQMVDNEAYYGSGGTINFDGRTDTKMPLGLFSQYMLGNTSNYNIGFMTKENFESHITSRLIGHEQFSPDGNGPEVVVRTGKGGLAQVHNFLKDQPKEYGLEWDSTGIIQGTGGNNRNLAFMAPRFNRWMSASGVRFRVEYEPTLDPIEASDIVNPMVTVNNGVNGLRLSSYIYIIDDLSSNNTGPDGSNICEVLYEPDYQLRRWWENGQLAYPGTESQGGGWGGSARHPGFVVYMALKHKALWLKDPTKSFMLKPINPATGVPIFEYR
jgi:hypothetical protein